MTSQTPKFLATRRRLLLGAGAATALIGADRLGMPFISRGLAAGPIKIGVSAAKGGPLGDTEAGIRRAAQLAVNAVSGKVLDQPIELVAIEETTTADAVANVKKAIEQHKIVGMIGGSESSRALALEKLAGEAKVPLLVHTSMLDDITGKGCNSWTYRVPAPYGVQYAALGPYLAGYDKKKWFTVGVDGTSGPVMMEYARKAMKRSNATEVGTVTVPQATTDFAEVIAKIKAANPDAVVGALYGQSIAAFLKSWKAAGMTGKILFAQVGVNDGDLWPAGADAMTGTFSKTWHYSNEKNSKDDKKFVADYVATFKGRPPSGISWQSFTATRSLIAAIAKAEAAEPEKIRVALEAIRWPSGDVIMRYRDFDHQLLNRVVLLETKSNITHEYDWWDAEVNFPEKASELGALYGTQEQNGCKMATS